MTWRDVVLVAVSGTLAFGLYDRVRVGIQLDRYEAIAQAATDTARLESQRADSLDSILAAKAAAEADSIGRAVEARLAPIHTRIQVVRSIPVPDTAADLVAERDAIIDELRSVIEEQQAAYAKLALAYDYRGQAIDELQSGIDRLTAAIEARPRPPSLLSRLLPKPGIGGAVVWDDGFEVKPALTLSWSL